MLLRAKRRVDGRELYMLGEKVADYLRHHRSALLRQLFKGAEEHVIVTERQSPGSIPDLPDMELEAAIVVMTPEEALAQYRRTFRRAWAAAEAAHNVRQVWAVRPSLDNPVTSLNYEPVLEYKHVDIRTMSDELLDTLMKEYP